MTRCHGSLARILYTLFYLKILFFFNTFLHLKTKNQKLIDVMKTVAADIDFQQLSCEMSLMYYLSGSMICWRRCINIDQRAKKVVSGSPGLVDFAIGPVNSVFNLPNGQVMYVKEFE